MADSGAEDHCDATLGHLALTVQNSLRYEKDWTNVRMHTISAVAAGSGARVRRPLLSGLPPRRLYVHPDEQIAILKAEKDRDGERIPQPPELEWVLPMQLSEKWTMARFAAVFDAINPIPPAGDEDGAGCSPADTAFAALDTDTELWRQWRGPKRGKRIVIAIVQDDSTISYYVMHDGIVKPRQN